MKIKLENKTTLCLSVTPTISVNTNNTTGFPSIRKRMLNLNCKNKGNNCIRGGYNLNLRNEFTSKYNNTETDMIFTQSLGDLSKVRCFGDTKVLRFRKLIPQYNVIRNNNINNTNITDSCIREDKCESLLNKKKKIKCDNVCDNTHIRIKTKERRKVNDIENKKCNLSQQQRTHNYKLKSLLCKKLLTPHQMHLISSTRRQTNKTLPSIRNTTTTTKPVNYFNKQVIQDFIYKTFPSPCNDQLPSTTHIVFQNVLSLHNYSLFGVFNSTGKDGYHLACIAKAQLEYTFSSLSTYLPSLPSPHYTETDIYSSLIKDNFSLITNAFTKVNSQLQLSQYNKQESGFSLLLLFSIGNNIISVNTGADVKGIRLTYTTDNQKEVINCTSLTNITPTSSLLSPSITTTNNSTSNTKCIFISTTDLFTKLGQTTICKLLSKAIPFSSAFHRYVIDIPVYLHTLYSSSSCTSYTVAHELSCIVLYY